MSWSEGVMIEMNMPMDKAMDFCSMIEEQFATGVVTEEAANRMFSWVLRRCTRQEVSAAVIGKAASFVHRAAALRRSQQEYIDRLQRGGKP